MLLALGTNPLRGYASLVSGAFGSWDALADTAIKSVPLLLVGTGICIAFRTGVINLGGEGQILAGAILSTVVALAITGEVARADATAQRRRPADVGRHLSGALVLRTARAWERGARTIRTGASSAPGWGP